MTPEVGRTYHLREPDYRYGTGPLTVQVLRVLRRTRYGGEPWWEVEAMCKTSGHDGLGQERLLYICAAALGA